MNEEERIEGVFKHDDLLEKWYHGIIIGRTLAYRTSAAEARHPSL